MPSAQYETRTDSVLAWKKAQKLGRFDPDAGTIEEQKNKASEREIEERGKSIVVNFLLLCIFKQSRTVMGIFEKVVRLWREQTKTSTSTCEKQA
jgi:hypothetical protein